MRLSRSGLFIACLGLCSSALLADPAGGLKINDGGKVIVRSSLTVNGGNIEVEDGGSLVLDDATVTAPSVDIFEGGEFVGNGDILGSLTNAGTLFLDNPVSVLGVDGDVTFASTSLLKLRILGGTPGQYSFIGATGSITVGGEVQLTVGSGFTGRVSTNPLDLLRSTTSIQGAFDNVASFGTLSMADGGTVRVNYSGSTFTVSNLVHGVAGPSYALDLLHTTGDQVHGEVASVKYTTFGVPALRASGAAAFSTVLQTDGGPLPAIVGTDTADVVARKGDLPYSPSGPAFATFGDPIVNPAGDIVFPATLSGATSVTAATNSGLWTTIGGSITEVVRTGGDAHGILNGKIKTLVSAGLTNTSLIPYVATLSGPGVSGMGLYLWDAGNSTLLLRQGAEATFDHEPARTVKTFSTLTTVAGSPGQGRSTADGAVVARVTFTDGVTGLAELTATGNRLLVKSGGTVPTAPVGAKFSTFGQPALNADGDLAFLAKLTRVPNQITSLNDQAIYADTASGDTTLIARSGELAPGASAARFKSFADPVYNANQDTAFIGTLNKDGTGIWWHHEGKLSLVARKSARPTGLPVNAEWDTFTSVSLPDDLGPVFLAKMRTGRGGVTAKNNIGIWAAESSGFLHLVARTGQSIQIHGTTKVITALTFLPVVLGTPDAGRNYNAEKQIVFKATFADKSQALLRATLP